ncbi:MAG: hypothetical protein AAGF93_07145 [Cyanobacteria bacterium P01_H01_bin.105]
MTHRTFTTNSQGRSASASSRSTSYTNAEGAGGSSSARATSSDGDVVSSQEQVFTPGATSSESRSSAVATSDSASASTDVSAPADDTSQETEENHSRLVFHIGNNADNQFHSSDGQDIMTGYGGADTFELSHNQSSPIFDIYRADIITDFNRDEDSLQFTDDITIGDLEFESIDFNNDTIAESTAIRLGPDGPIVAVALNVALNTDFSTASVLEPIADDNTEANSDDNSNSSTESTIDFLLGTSTQTVLASSSDRDIFIGSNNADIFSLETTGVDQLAHADVIIGFDLDGEDRIQLDADISISHDIRLETVDLDLNGIAESTSIQRIDGSILAIVQGTVDTLGNTLLSSHAFISAGES